MADAASKYTPNYRSDVVKTDYVAIPIGNKTVKGYQSTFKDGTSKWIYEGDVGLSSNFDYSTFTGKKDSKGNWVWSQTTANSTQNLATRIGATPADVNKALYQAKNGQSSQIATVLDGNRVNQLGGVKEAQKVDPKLPAAKGDTTGNPYEPEQKPSEDADKIKTESGTSREGTRKEYGDVKYPENLTLEFQDCIKFSIIEYQPPGLKSLSSGGQSEANRIVSLSKGKSGKSLIPGLGAGRKILGTITLPIPGNISDSNQVSWQDDSLSEIQKAGGNIVSSFIGGGAEAAGAAAGESVEAAVPGGNTDAAEQSITAAFTKAAVESQNLQQRMFGTMMNNNTELLFTGPGLRQFSFTFRMTPRSKSEAENVRKIIRWFKQSMSVKRSSSSLLLKSPHTFAIAYLSKNTLHPYLNKFKECALLSCNVTYTPDGTYMTYDDGSMTAYEMSLSFQELEPLYDDEYTSDDTNIGF